MNVAVREYSKYILVAGTLKSFLGSQRGSDKKVPHVYESYLPLIKRSETQEAAVETLLLAYWPPALDIGC